MQQKKEDVIKEAVKELKNEKQTKNQASFILTPDYIYEQVVSPANDRSILRLTGALAGGAGHAGGSFATCFLKYDIAKDSYESLETAAVGGIDYEPVNSKLFDDENSVLIFPSGALDYGSDTELIKDIQQYIHDYLQVSDFYEKILPYYVLFTWVHDAFPFTAYIHFVGITSTGKSRAIDTLSQLCYKSLRGSGSITVASLFRISDQFQGTMFLNEFDLGRSGDEGYGEKMQILKAGSENYAVFRTEGEGKKQVEKFKLKGPKVFAGEKPIENAALESRTIMIPMSKKTRRIPVLTPHSFKEKGDKLRCKLLLWRFRHLTKINIEEIAYGYPELERFDSRIQQVMLPMYYLASDEAKKLILSYVEDMERQVKEARREELPGQTFILYLNSVNQENKLSLKEITDQLNETVKYKYSYRKIGNVFSRELGIEIKEEGHLKIRYPQYNEEKIKILKEHYGILDENTKAEE